VFIEVERIQPGYKSIDMYLVRIDRDIEKETQRTWSKEQRGLKRKGKKAQSERARVRGISEDFKLEKNGGGLVKEMEKERKKRIVNKAKDAYREALQLYKADKFMEAKYKFIELESFSPGYKSTLSYLKKIDTQIAKQDPDGKRRQPDIKTNMSRQELIKQTLLDVEQNVYLKDLQIFTKPVHKHKQNLEKFEKNKSVAGKDYVLRDRRKELKAQRRSLNLKYQKEFRALYDKAVTLYRSGSYEEAQRLFAEIERIKPGYKKAASYYKKATAKIKKGLQNKSKNAVVQKKIHKTREDIVNEALDTLDKRM